MYRLIVLLSVLCISVAYPLWSEEPSDAANLPSLSSLKEDDHIEDGHRYPTYSFVTRNIATNQEYLFRILSCDGDITTERTVFVDAEGYVRATKDVFFFDVLHNFVPGQPNNYKLLSLEKQELASTSVIPIPNQYFENGLTLDIEINDLTTSSFTLRLSGLDPGEKVIFGSDKGITCKIEYDPKGKPTPHFLLQEGMPVNRIANTTKELIADEQGRVVVILNFDASIKGDIGGISSISFKTERSKKALNHRMEWGICFALWALEEVETQQAMLHTLANWTVFNHPTVPFSIELPESWATMTKCPDPEDLTNTKFTYFLFFCRKDQILMGGVSAVECDISPSADLQEVLWNAECRETKNMKGVVYLEQGDLETIQGGYDKYVIFKENGKTYWKSFHWEGNRRYRVELFANDKDFEALRDEIHQVIYSFQVKK